MMIVFLVFPSIAQEVRFERHRITKPGETTASFINETGIFLINQTFPQSFNISIANSTENEYCLLNYDIGRNLLLTKQNILLNCSSNCDFSYSYWITPTDLCKDGTYIINLESELEFTIKSAINESSICFISQTSNSNVVFSLHSQRSTLSTTIFTSNNEKIQKDGKNIHYSSTDQFLISIKSVSNYDATVSISSKLGIYRNTECSVKHASLFVDNEIIYPKRETKISNIICQSASESYLIGFLLLISAEIVLILLVFLLHLSGIIDFSVILGCTRPDAAFASHLRNTPKADGGTVSDHEDINIEREPCEEV